MISETKIDESFPLGRFKINAFHAPPRLDRNSNREGIMLFVWEDIPAKLTDSETPPVEGLYVEVKLRKQKWLTRSESHIDFRALSVKMTLAGGGILLTTCWKWKKLSNFKVYVLMQPLCAGEVSVVIVRNK